MRAHLFLPVLLFPVPLLQAQTAAVEMDEVVISSTPLGRTLFEQAQPVSVLEGRELAQAMQPTLGETLSRLPGVTSTGFAPGASRPVIRGLGDERIRILNNGVGTVDVSNVSPDHAVTVDPSLLERVEVVRGPAALLYGPNGVGGVVNLLDGRIPESRVEPGVGGWPIRGKLDSRYGTGSDLWSGAGQIDVGLGPVVLHFDGFRRRASDLVIPGDARSRRLQQLEPLPAGEKEPGGHLTNSAAETEGGAVGASWLWDGGFFGASYSWLNSHYGTVAEEAVTIDLEQRRWDGRGAFYEPFAGVKEISYKFGYSDYGHTEFEGPEAGTTFLIEGYDGRVELKHDKLGPFEGAVGFQTTHRDFSALGAEAFLPPVQSDTASVFVFEELAAGRLRYQGGLRFDHTTVESRSYSGFGRGRDLAFNALSGSAGLVWELPQDYSVALNAAYTQRAPTYVELLADGPHLATAAYERGDAGLGLEKSLGLDLTLRKSSGQVTGSVGGFYNRFNNYIALIPTGADFDFEGEALPVQQYQNAGVDFCGGEAEVTFHLLAPQEAAENLPGPGKQPSGKSPTAAQAAGARQKLDLQLSADYVITRDRTNGGSLPRIPPFRAGASLIYEWDRLSARLEGQYVAAQHRTADFELPTDAWFLLHAGVGWRVLDGPVNLELFLRGTNLLNAEARQHTSFLKDIAPMEGRAVLAGLAVSF